MADFRFTNEHSPSALGGVADILTKPRLWIPTERDYPSHGDWVQRTEAQLADDKKRAMVAYNTGRPIGTVVYRRHDTRVGAVEIRNISINQDRGRGVGTFLLRTTEYEALHADFPDCTEIVGDTKATNGEMIQFLLAHGNVVEEITDLYGQGTGLDVVLSKQLAD